MKDTWGPRAVFGLGWEPHVVLNGYLRKLTSWCFHIEAPLALLWSLTGKDPSSQTLLQWDWVRKSYRGHRAYLVTKLCQSKFSQSCPSSWDLYETHLQFRIYVRYKLQYNLRNTLHNYCMAPTSVVIVEPPEWNLERGGRSPGWRQGGDSGGGRSIFYKEYLLCTRVSSCTGGINEDPL